MFGDKRVEKKKTPVYKCNLNPIFNATFEFDVPWEQIRDCALDVQVRTLEMDGWMDLGFGWVDGWMDRWMDRWMDLGGWVDGWMGE